MLTEICQYLRNWFERDIILGDFVVSGGVITAADGTALPLLQGQYYRIIGSVFNDGAHQYGTKEVTNNNVTSEVLIEQLIDEPIFSGAVWSMAVPPAVVALDAEISSWIADNAQALNSPYQSESFGGYSYSLKTGNSVSGEDYDVTWQNQFKSKLSPWRKI